MAVLKLQSALEYLMTYSWAILIIALVVVALFALGVLNPGGIAGNQCVAQAQFSCLDAFMLPNGLVTVNFQQETSMPINVTAYSCNSNYTIAHSQLPVTPSNQVTLQIGGNSTFNIQCWAGGSKYSGTPGQVFTGYVFVNYTDLNTGFPHTAPLSVSLKLT